jgi:2-polyprenyl-6-methoxyphenol hydroxylase-like FAD-dependent oxidoreductase
LSTWAVEARGPQATRSQLVLVRPGAQAALVTLGLSDITEGRRTTTLRHVENRLRAALLAATPSGADPAPAAAVTLSVHWHTRVADLAVRADGVRVTLHDDTSGVVRTVCARHVIDASGGRLEALGRPARQQAGPSHLVIAAEYTATPWFEGIVGVRDARTQELYLLFPTWGRKGVIAYFDAPPGSAADAQVLAQRFEAIGASLGLGQPLQPAATIDVCQRALLQPNKDRVVPIGDAIGTVDILLGAGMSTAIEDGVDAARAIAAAQREAALQGEGLRVWKLSARLYARHRASNRLGRLMLLMRPAIARLWPSTALPAVSREDLRPPPLLWPAVRFVFGRRPQAS